MTTHTQDIGKEVSSVIAQSWHRCSKFMQRETWQAPHQAQGLTFESICRRKTALLTIAQAALEDAWEFMDGRPCALLILDESACILSRCGDPQTVEQLAEPRFSRRQLLCGKHYWQLRVVAGDDAGAADKNLWRSAL